MCVVSREQREKIQVITALIIEKYRKTLFINQSLCEESDHVFLYTNQQIPLGIFITN